MKDTEKQLLLEQIQSCQKLLVGLGEEWKQETDYQSLEVLLEGKDYFIVTTSTSGAIFNSGLDSSKIVAPCGNETWRQCEKACTKDIWEQGEVADDVCPHCGAVLVGNTIAADTYIEEGYLPQWKIYTEWLSRTLNKELLVLELGVGFQTPTVIRWPFEKTAFFNKKAQFYRINEKFSQISEELKDKAVTVGENSVTVISTL